MTSPDREAVLREVFAHLSAGEWDAAGELAADDVVFELAYAPEFMEMPVRGRAGLVGLYATILGPMFESFSIGIDEVILGADPDVAVATYSSNAVVKHNGNTYRNRYVGIFHFRDGAIAFWREYHNPEETTRALT